MADGYYKLLIIWFNQLNLKWFFFLGGGGGALFVFISYLIYNMITWFPIILDAVALLNEVL